VSLRSIVALPRYAALLLALPPSRATVPAVQTMFVTPINGTVLTTTSINSLQIAWCDPSGSMVGHSVTWQGQPLSGEVQSWASRAGCGYALTSIFTHVNVDYTKPLTLVSSATDRSGQVTTNTTTYSMSSNLVQLFVSPASQSITPRRGANGSATFTVSNTGGITLPLTLSATCGTMSSCVTSPASLTLGPSSSQTVAVNFVASAGFGVSNTIYFTATSTAGGQNISRSTSTLTRTPDAEPWTTPKAAAGASAVFAGGQYGVASFTVGSNPANSSGTFSLSTVCPSSWDCAPDSTQLSPPASGGAATVSIYAPNLIGSPTTPPAAIQLIASLWNGSTLLAADTGVIQGYLGYHTPKLSPKSTAANVANGVPHTDSFTLTNSGNANATYTLTGVCGTLGANGCTTNVPSITLAAGASGNVSVSYTPPTSGSVSGTVKLIAKYQSGSLAEADTASVAVTSGDVNPPTLTVTPSEGAVLTTRAVNAVVTVCDSDGIVGAPSLTANGSTMSGSFVSGTQSGCATAGSTTFGVTAQPGTNTLVATVSDGVHTTTQTRTFVYDEAVELTPSVAAVTPTRTRAAQSASADTFTVRNPGSLAATYTLAAGCTAAVSGCSASQSSIAVAAGQTATVIVSFTSGATSGNAIVSLSATITGATGHVITSSASASVMVDATPPTIAISPTGVVTATSPPSVTIQWCDAEGSLASHTVTFDGVALPDAFTTTTVSGCAAAGTSTYSNLSMSTGPHSIGASAADAVGHVTTTTANLTFTLPALSDFRPEVTPKAQPVDVFTGVTVQRTFTVRNAGVANAPYQLAAFCPAVTCQISKTSTTLSPGASDSAIITFTPTASMGASATVGMRASYTNAANQTIADTGTVVAALAQMASHAVPSVTPQLASVTVEPGVITSYYFVLKNTGTIAATYDFTSITAGGFTWPQGWAVFDADNPSLGPLSSLDVAPGQSVQVYLSPASPTTAGITGQITLTATFHASDGSVSSASGVMEIFTKAPDRGIGITPNVGVQLTVSVDRTVAHHQVTFVMLNTGVMSGSYQYSSACHGFAQNCVTEGGPASPFVLAAGASANITIGYDATGVDNGFDFIELFGTQVETGRQAVGTILLSASASPALAASVSPANDQVSPAAHSAQSVTFTITNTGGVGASFTYAVSCSGAVTSCASTSGLSGSTATLAPNASAQIVVTYQSGDAGSTGTVSLNARSADGSVNVTGTRTVSVPVPTTLTVHARAVNPDGNVSRGQCLTIAAGSGAAYECGDLRLVHALPTTTTMNKARAPTLIFSSDQARPGGVVAAEVSVPVSITANVIRATLSFPAKTAVIVQRDFAWSAALSDSRPRRIAVRFEGPDWDTGAYKYVFQVQAMSGSTVLSVASDTGVVAVVSRVNSPFGRGWWLDGLEQISITTPDSSQRLWVGGDGSTRLYSKVPNSGDAKWVVTPSLDRPDTLYHTASGYKRRLRDSAYVTYDAGGQQDTTVNALRYRTTFSYLGGRLGAGGKLTAITMPTPSGAAAVTYQFQYTTAGTLPVLSVVTAPQGPNGPRTVSIVRDNAEASRIASITDPDHSVVTFVSDANEHVVERIDQMGHAVHFGFDAASHFLVADTIELAGEPWLAAAFCPAQSASLGSCAPSVVDSSAVRTKYTSPRHDGADTTAFYVTRYGAPRKIVDALGRTTIVCRSLATLPLLVTRVAGPGGGVDSTEYDLVRALPIRTLTKVDSSRFAVTRTFWNATWDEPDSTVAPEGEFTSLTYDARGNRKTQSSGRGASARMATFNYDASNRVTSMFERGALDSSYVFYDAVLGNVSRTRTPLGIVSYVDRDAIGRDSVTRAPIDAAQQHFTKVETRYDVMDRDVLAVTSGPRVQMLTAVSGGYDETQRDSLIVGKAFDVAGTLVTLTRRVNPNTNSLNASGLTTSWRYDAAYRKRSEVAPDGTRDTTIYGDGVNVTRTADRRHYGLTMTYDALNRLKTRTLDPTVTHTMDTLGTRTDPGGTESFAYDDAGNMKEAANQFAIVDREYNVGGTIRHEVQRIATESGQFGQHDYDLWFSYDLENRRLTLRQPWQALSHMIGDGNPGPLSYQYNEFGDLSQISMQGLSPFSYFYDQRGRLDSLLYPNGVAELRRYDDDSRLTFLLHRAPNAGLGWHTDGLADSDTIQWAKMYLDAGGRADSVHTYGGAATYNGYTPHGALAWYARHDSVNVGTRTETYAVDPLGNVRESSVTFPTQVEDGIHYYNPLTARLDSIAKRNTGADDFLQLSQYDSAGNQILLRQARFVPDKTGHVGLPIETDGQFAYDANGRMRFYTDRGAPHPNVDLFPEEEYTDQETRYDALGRRVWVKTNHIGGVTLTQCGDYCSVERYVWDGDQLLAEFRMPDSIAEQDTAIVYDLVQTSHDILEPPPPVRQYSWLWGQVLYTHGLGMDQPLAVHRSGAGADTLDLSSFAMYPLHDWRGNATAIAFAGGRPLFNNNVQFTPPLPTDDNRLLTAYRERTNDSRRVTSWMGSLLTGQMTASGLEYRRNRYYDPKSGRFTQEDPIGLGGGLNLYGFGGGDPVNYRDPFGLCVWDLCIGEGYGVALAAAGFATLVAAAYVDMTNKFGSPTTWFSKSSTSGETSAAAGGRAAHKAWDAGAGFNKEVRLPSGKRCDAYNPETCEIKELKPDNDRAKKRGEKQLNDYKDEMEEKTGKPHQTILETYKRVKA
jgi:RHS repeat-associated protein